jgi:small subunit ribosomal protein S16
MPYFQGIHISHQLFGLLVSEQPPANAPHKLHNITMVVRIRLARFGKRNSPFYNIVVAHARYDCQFSTPPAPPLMPRSRTARYQTLTSYVALRTARNSKPLEVLGTFDPKPQAPKDGEGRQFKDIKLDVSRAKYWLGVGAQPSDPAWKLLSMVRS